MAVYRSILEGYEELKKEQRERARQKQSLEEAERAQTTNQNQADIENAASKAEQ